MKYGSDEVSPRVSLTRSSVNSDTNYSNEKELQLQDKQLFFFLKDDCVGIVFSEPEPVLCCCRNGARRRSAPSLPHGFPDKTSCRATGLM
ncbi:uncharacterized [Tachysurus ichikawai]